jgi:predicted O-methyltransferase YrrM
MESPNVHFDWASAMDPHELALILSMSGSTNREEVALLYHLASRTTAGCIVEVGSSCGRSTVALALGSRRGAGVAVYAIEPHEHFAGVLGGVFTPHNRTAFLENVLRSGTSEIVRLVNLSSETVAPGWQWPVELAFIDGDHRLEGVRRDFDCWTTHLVDEGLLVLHDSTDPGLGPMRVAQSAVASGRYVSLGVVSRATILKKQPALTRG